MRSQRPMTHARRVKIVSDLSTAIRRQLTTLLGEVQCGSQVPGLSEFPPVQLQWFFAEALRNVAEDPVFLTEDVPEPGDCPA